MRSLNKSTCRLIPCPICCDPLKIGTIRDEEIPVFVIFAAILTVKGNWMGFNFSLFVRGEACWSALYWVLYKSIIKQFVNPFGYFRWYMDTERSNGPTFDLLWDKIMRLWSNKRRVMKATAQSLHRAGETISRSGIFMTSGGLTCGCDVSRYHGDSRHMFRTSTRGASDANERGHANVHAQTHAYTHTHPEGKQDRKLSGEIRVNILFFLWDFNSKISLWRFKYIKPYPLKMQLIYALLYSHQPLCLLFISALLMFIFIAISDTSVSVLFQSASKVKFSPSKPSFPKHPLTHPF